LIPTGCGATEARQTEKGAIIEEVPSKNP